MSQCFTDFDFFIGADRAVKKHAAISTAPVFYYYFQFDGELGIVKKALKLKNPGKFMHTKLLPQQM